MWSASSVWIVAAVLLAGALALRLHRLDVQPLWLDEGRTWADVTGSRLGALLLGLLRPTEAYPLFYLVVKVATRLLGDSEWALRLPSALAGSMAVPALFALGVELRGRVLGAGAALLLLVSPFALWQAQDAKAYSLTLLVAIGLAWSLARALRRSRRGDWLVFALLAVVAVLTHRLLVLTLVACAAVFVLAPRERPLPPRWRAVLLGGVISLAAGLLGALIWALRYQSAGNQFAATNPVRALWLTFGQFAVGQWPGAVPRLALLPFVLLTVLGGWLVLRAAVRDRHRGALLVAVLGALPALLFAVVLVFQPLYEARYFTLAFPFWLLTLVWALPERLPRPNVTVQGVGAGALYTAALLLMPWALFLPDRGIFSGAVVKEDYRGAIRELAERVHPDDLVIVHPDTILPLYRYYAPRVASHPMPEPLIYDKLGRTTFGLRELDIAIRADLAAHKRAWLLIAPDHAAVVDPPNREAGDDVGLVGLAFQYGDRNRRIQCNNPAYSGYVGVRLYCNNIPDIQGVVPQPATPVEATFGSGLKLRGYTLLPFETGVRPGASLPLTLFWEPLRSLADTDWVVFVHLTRPDDPTPLAQIDGRPMEGGLPTALWTDVGAQLHDDRTMQLPVDLSPGQYVLRLGVYRADDGARLPVQDSSQPVADDAVVLGSVTVEAARP